MATRKSVGKNRPIVSYNSFKWWTETACLRRSLRPTATMETISNLPIITPLMIITTVITITYRMQQNGNWKTNGKHGTFQHKKCDLRSFMWNEVWHYASSFTKKNLRIKLKNQSSSSSSVPGAHLKLMVYIKKPAKWMISISIYSRGTRIW